MALRGTRIENFDELRCIGALEGLEFYVSTTTFQKSYIGWPYQPPTEKLLKFNLIDTYFMILQKTFSFKTTK